MSEAKEKDRILAQINSFTPHSEIVGLEKHLDELVRDGYVNVWRDEQGDIIDIRLTAQGKSFINDCGYTKIERENRKRYSRKLILKILSWMFGIVATVIGGWIVWKLTSSTEAL